ncbi:hypothetical protein M0R72_11155 [Candidatus Pacearchaeota archaeon]|jgi:hypothetical protein|nr:hypothetical protein [Candidatus Pacearchaeota archaeon]
MRDKRLIVTNLLSGKKFIGAISYGKKHADRIVKHRNAPGAAYHYQVQ